MHSKNPVPLLIFTAGALFFTPQAQAFYRDNFVIMPMTSDAGMLPVSVDASKPTPGAVNTPQAAQAKSFIQNMGDQVIGYIKDGGANSPDGRNKLKAILNSNFDMYTISRFTLGRYWKQLTPAQQDDYRKLFEDMIVSIYADKFSHYDGQKFQVKDVSMAEGYDYSVNSFIVPKTGENIAVRWRVRTKEGSFQIVDVAIEEVSMIITQRSDFASVIERNGGKAAVIIDYLRGKTSGNAKQ
jgi:phospholipid transport system substrate-binding protein